MVSPSILPIIKPPPNIPLIWENFTWLQELCTSFAFLVLFQFKYISLKTQEFIEKYSGWSVHVSTCCAKCAIENVKRAKSIPDVNHSNNDVVISHISSTSSTNNEKRTTCMTFQQLLLVCRGWTCEIIRWIVSPWKVSGFSTFSGFRACPLGWKSEHRGPSLNSSHGEAPVWSGQPEIVYVWGGSVRAAAQGDDDHGEGGDNDNDNFNEDGAHSPQTHRSRCPWWPARPAGRPTRPPPCRNLIWHKDDQDQADSEILINLNCHFCSVNYRKRQFCNRDIYILLLRFGWENRCCRRVKILWQPRIFQFLRRHLQRSKTNEAEILRMCKKFLSYRVKVSNKQQQLFRFQSEHYIRFSLR